MDAGPSSSMRNPALFSTFVGRRTELDTLQRWLEGGARVVSVVGPPGVGKTRLLRRLGDRVHDASKPGAIDAAALELATATQTVYLDHVDDLALDRVVEALSGNRRAVLVTASRQRPALPGEVLRLGPMNEADAAGLWADRAMAVGIDVVWETARQIPFDRFPLTIEVLAERFATADLRSLDEMVAELPRIRRAFDELLQGPEWIERALLGCAAFAGPFSVRDAEQVLGLSVPIARVLSVLHDRSLLLRANTEYLVPDFVRALALGRARPEQRGAAFQRHARHFVEHGGEEAELLSVFDRFAVADPVLGARALLACDPLMPTRALTSAVTARTSELIDAVGDVELSTRLLLWRGFASVISGDRPRALEDLQRAHRLAQDIGAGELGTRALEALGLLAQWEGNFHGVGEILSTAGAGSDTIRLRNLGVLRLGEGDLEAARTMLEASCVAAEPDDPWQAAVSRGILAMLEHELGRFLEARRTFQDALARLEVTKNTWFSGVTTLWLALLELDEGRLAEARAGLERSANMLGEVRDQWFSHANTGYRGVLAHLEGRFEDARELLDRAVAHATRANDVYRSAIFLPHLGATWARLGAPESAADAFAAAAEHARAMDNPNLAAVRRLLATIAKADATDAARVIEDHRPLAARSSDVRLAIRLVRSAHAGIHRLPTPLGTSIGLVVHEGADWFIAGGKQVNLSRRRSLRLVLAALVLARQTSPGVELSTADLLEAGWPGEKVLYEAGRQRVYVTLVELRKLGLGPWLLHRGRGYLLDPEVTVSKDGSAGA